MSVYWDDVFVLLADDQRHLVGIALFGEERGRPRRSLP